MPTTFANSIDSNPIYAARAEQDKDGQRIDTTYAKSASLATVATTGNYDDLTDKPDLSIYAESSNLATVATTGSYDDLVDKPTIPQAQVNSDWNSNSGVSQILNRPTLSTVATTGDYNDLVNKPSIPAAQINSDWSESDTTSKAYIQNKPDLSVYATGAELTSGLATKQDVISDLATIRSGAAAGATAVQPGDLATVATTGDYDDLTDKPDLSVYATGSELTAGLATKQDTISDLATIRSGAAAGATAVQPGDLATVATTGDYDDLTDKPDLSVYATTAAMNTALAGKQDTISDLATIRSGAAAGATAVQPGDLATVATTGAYSDLSGTPSIPTKTSDLTNDNGFITLADVPAQVQSDWTESDSTDPSYIANKPNLAAVATSGDYADLSGTPTINNVPTVTSSDDAKVLKASYTGGVGSYSWDSLPANSAVFTVDVDSYEDIVSAYNDGKICFAQSSGSDYLYPLTRAHVDGTYSTFNFWLDFTPATTFDTNQGIAERTRYTVTSSGWTTTKEKVAPYILAASRIATSINTDTKVLSVSADIPVITSGNDKVIDIADTGRIEVASSAFSGTATKTDTFTRDGYSFYTSDGSRLIGNKWTPFTSYMSGSYTVSFSGGDSSKNLTFTSAGAYTWDDNTLADPSAFPANGTIHYGLFQGELDANNRMTLNPTLIGNLISDVANVTSSDSSVSATVSRPKNVSMTINVVAGKKLLTAFYVQFSGVTYFLSTTQNPFNKPTILISKQIGNIAKVVEEAPVDTKSYVRKDGAWVEESGGGGSYTAGNGIDITNNVVSVDTSVVATQTDLADKEDAFDVGTGLEMDTSGATPTLQVEAPVDIVAGPGIVIDNPDGNTLRVSTDENYETVLWDGNGTALSTATLDESIYNFEYIRIDLYMGSDNIQGKLVKTDASPSYISVGGITTESGSYATYVFACSINVTNSGKTLTVPQKGNGFAVTTNSAIVYFQNNNIGTVRRIVGIHRIANN